MGTLWGVDDDKTELTGERILKNNRLLFNEAKIFVLLNKEKLV